MTAPARDSSWATPVDVERRLYELEQELVVAVRDLRKIEADYLQQKAYVEISRARAYLSSDGKNMKDRESAALLLIEEDLLSLAVVEAKVRGARENAKRIYTQIDIARSVGVLARAGMNVG